MELYIIRHGETAWNKEQRLQGRTDIALNDYGIELAEITSKALRDIDFDIIYSSPLQRAYKTAEILRGDRDIPIVVDSRLIEMCFGSYEGVPAKDLPSSFANYFDAPEQYIAPEDGESYEDVCHRAQDFINDIIVPNSAKYQRMLIVAHGALNRALMITMNHQTIADYWKGVFQKNCCVNIYEVNGKDFQCIQNGKIYYEAKPGTNFGRDDAE